jgi:hypothetical protein
MEEGRLLERHRGLRRSVALFTTVVAVAGLTLTGVYGVSAQADGAWTRVELPDVPVRLELYDVVAGGPGFIAVGGGSPEGSETQTALILTSADGVAWRSATLEGDAAIGRISSLISVGGAWYLAVGGRCCPDNAAVWISQDGLTWQLVPDVPAAFFGRTMTDVTATPEGFLAVGCEANLECSGGAVFQSSDGMAWTSSNPFLWIPSAVVSESFGFLSVGQTDSLGQSVAAVSPDGTDWTPAGLPEQMGALDGALVTGPGVVAVGETRDPDTMPPTGQVILSADGVDWSDPLDPWAVPGASFLDLAVTGDNMVVVGFTQLESGETRPSAWLGLTDGPPSAAMFSPDDDDAIVRSVAVSADGGPLVSVGVVSGGSGQQAGIWVSQ